MIGKAKKLAQSALARAGYEVINLRHNERLGWSWIRDIDRLAAIASIPIDTIFDVGANAGQTALELRAQFPLARIHCFEPTPSTYETLAAAVVGDARITPHALALGPVNGTATLQCFDSPLLNSCAPEPPFKARFNQPSTAISVPMRMLDDVCAEHHIDHISILKVDAEGFDLEILKGARRMLGEARVDFVITEMNGATTLESNAGNDLGSIAALLNPAGFRFVASYTDGVAQSLPLYVIANALFMRAEGAA